MIEKLETSNQFQELVCQVMEVSLDKYIPLNAELKSSTIEIFPDFHLSKRDQKPIDDAVAQLKEFGKSYAALMNGDFADAESFGLKSNKVVTA